MRILSLDTAYSFQNFAFYNASENKFLTVYGEDKGRKSLEIFPKIFVDLNIPIRDIDIFAVNLGIGYSTSLRVGVTFAKTYAQSLNKPLITYSSFEALMQFAPSDGKYLTLLKVSRYWVYGIWEKREEEFVEIQKPKELKEEDIENLKGEKLKLLTTDWVGNLKEVTENGLKPKETYIVPIRGFSEVGAKIALRKHQRGEFAELFKVEPIYFRPPV
jgi:tRNA threonylcarbamoyladenosine biosynthesis protein TsaB